jgi:ribosomal protein L18E
VETNITHLKDEQVNMAAKVKEGIAEHLNKVKIQRNEEYGKIMEEIQQNEVVDLVDWIEFWS